MVAQAHDWRGKVRKDGERLLNTLTRALTETGGASSGGFIVPLMLWDDVIDKVRVLDGPSSRCRWGKTTTEECFVPGFNESKRSDGNRWGGIWGQWKSETTDLSTIATQGSLASINFKMNRLVLYIPISNDLLKDAMLFDTMANVMIYGEIKYQLDYALLLGNGVGMPMGVVNDQATIQVSNGSGSVAAVDLDNMWKHLYAPAKKNSVWMMADDSMAAIDQAADTDNWPISLYTPAGVYGNPTPFLKGRPVICVEQLPAIGNTGSVVLCDWNEYLLMFRRLNDGDSGAELAAGLPQGLVEQTRSPHFLYDVDQTAIKIKVRCDGHLTWNRSITNNNSQSVSPCVILVH